jgi:hypothetical protein
LSLVERCYRVNTEAPDGAGTVIPLDKKVGVKQTDDHIWLGAFMDYDLGFFDDETCSLEPIDNPFGPKLSPISPE